MTPARCLALLAALMIGAPASGRVIWIDLCDAAHPGRHIPLPLDRDGAPAKACHAACAALADKRTAKRLTG